MRVRMKVTLSGTRDGEAWPPRGELVDLPDAEAADMVAAGLAEKPGEDAPRVEEATAPEAETSTPSRRKPSARGK
ncbi:hypothetical protein QR97_27890 [Streptomyces sp. PBH53]|uniref:hypothetical protein n=1 Tax=Streptomyces sp. PBH53 TaxID=1577075 RepID=UPI0006563E12|nr:hypothetical protein [Streptomyces sp. PBH53]AKN71232.1 hypothetical protein QR97_16730 [Streptomyces sp. PBH53]AKN73073.1 hypothetical protein QR97_27890 [Streptomyces sp. PBH53]